jgi:hypothetical protein
MISGRSGFIGDEAKRFAGPAATRGCGFGGDDCSLCWWSPARRRRNAEAGLQALSAGGGMVARAGANLRHIAPTHPAARRCGSLTLPHRRSAPRKPAGRQKRRGTSPPQRRRPTRQRASDNFFVTHRKFVRIFLSNPEQEACKLGEPYVSLLSGNLEFLDRAKRVTNE